MLRFGGQRPPSEDPQAGGSVIVVQEDMSGGGARDSADQHPAHGAVGFLRVAIADVAAEGIATQAAEAGAEDGAAMTEQSGIVRGTVAVEEDMSDGSTQESAGGSPGGTPVAVIGLGICRLVGDVVPEAATYGGTGQEARVAGSRPIDAFSMAADRGDH